MTFKNHLHAFAVAAATALLSPMFACGSGVSLNPGGTTGSGGSAAADAGTGGGSVPADGGGAGATETLMPTPVSVAGCPCAPGGGVDVLSCGPPWPSSSGRGAPDAVVTPDGSTVAMNRCVLNASGGCGNALYLWSKADGTTKLADEAWVFALSQDGSAVLAERDPWEAGRLFLWKGGTAVDLPFAKAATHLLSADGSVVVSKDETSVGTAQAARWTAATGLVRLGDLAGGPEFSEPLAMTADGSTVVGYGNTAIGQDPFSWSAETGKMIAQGAVPNAPCAGVLTVAYANSGDGKTVVGTGLGNGGTVIFRWTAASGMVGLTNVFQNAPGESSYFFIWTPPLLVNADGTAVIGTAAGSDPGAPMAFRWTESEGVVALAPAGASIVRGASRDGARILGSRLTSNAVPGAPAPLGPPPTYAPFIWDNGRGSRDLADLLAQGGANLSGVVLGDPIALSSDGTTMVGHATCGTSEIIFRVTLPD
ncbi:MAG: hypothetical protein QOI66_5034 [Myxococcales bacterium]|nr:hypothetical protein [Myxococcales bacterium]